MNPELLPPAGQNLTSGEVDAMADCQGRTFPRRHDQESLRLDQAARQDAILNALPTHIALLDTQGLIISVNEAWRQFADANALHSPGHAVGVNYLAICDQATGVGSVEAHQVAQGIRSVLTAEAKSFSIEYPCHSATEQRWFLMTATPLSDERTSGAVVVHANITEHRRNEEALRRFRSALDTAVDAIFIVDRSTMQYIEVNATACSMLGYTRAQLLQMGPVQTSTAPLRQMERVYDSIIAGEATSELSETVLRRKDGSTFPVEAYRHAQRSGTGWIIVGVLRDITERKRSLETLRAAEQLQHKLADQLEVEHTRLVAAQRIAKIGSWETDLASLAAEWSDETHCIFETDRATFEVTHQNFLELVHPADRAKVEHAFRQSFTLHTATTIEHRLLLPGAKIKNVEEIWQVVYDERGKAIRAVGTCQDITERTWADELARRTSRRVARKQKKRVRIDLAILAVGTILIYALSSRLNWFEAMNRWVLMHEMRQLDDVIVAAMFLTVGLAVFALRRLHESRSELTGNQRKQATMRLLHDDMDRRVKHRTDELANANRTLSTEISDRKSAQIKLHEINFRFRQLAENIRSVFFLTNSDNSEVLYVNPAYEEIWGRTCASLYADASSWADAIHPDDRDRILASDQEGQRAAGFDNEYRIVRADGSVRWVHAVGFPVRNEAGEIYRIAATVEDITERRHAQSRINRLNRVYAVLSQINNLIVRVHDREELFSAACNIAIEAGGFRMAFIGTVDPGTKKVVLMASAGKDEDLLTAVRNTLSSNEVAPSTMVMTAIREKRPIVSNDTLQDPRVLLGSKYAAAGVRSLAVLPLMVGGEAVGTFVLYASVPEFFHDDEMKLLSELASNVAFAIDHIGQADRLNYLAYYDALTGLANRTLFLDRVAQSIRRCVVAGATLSIVLLDLERFKQVNDKLGRSAGDALLVQVANRLTHTLGDASLLARMGSDQFALLIPEEKREGDVSRFLERASRALLEDALSGEGSAIRVAAKFGVARFPDDGIDADSLFKNAEIALKLAKSSGESVAYFSNEMNARNTQRLALEEQLRVAVDTQQFVLHYQPKMDMISGELIGAEALLRWRHPDKGLLSPAEFIALAEETGLILQIGSWVINTVCAQQAAWIAAGLRVVPIAVNLSSVQFEKGDLRETVRGALASHSIDGKLLDLELTESAVMNDSAAVAETLRCLRELGVGLALDDFGTGYSSLAHLKRFPFDSVKIDSTFISDITHNAEDAAIATAIIAMAHSLKLKVVAEGVETLGQFNYLRARGCDEMQGCFFSPAVDKDVFESDLRSGKRMTLRVSAPADQRTLLLVDDEPRISAALSRMLRRDGYRILTATSGSEGLEVLATNAVQVIISDQRMPGMSGTEFLNTVNQMYPDTIRMILSGYTDLEVVTESVNRGAVFKFLTKPWNDDLLREHVRDAFRRYRPESLGK